MNHKAPTGLAYVHTWAPATLPKADPAPAFTLHKPAGDVGPVAMTPILASATVTAVGADQRSLTLSAAPDAAGMTGQDGGSAWLDLGEHGRWPVRVQSVDGAAVTLAAYLPADVPTGATGSLHWNVWEAGLSAAQVGAATLRRVRWSIEWTEDRGADRATSSRRASGLLDIVPNPFDTGVADADVVAVVPPLARLVPPEQTSCAPQIAAAADRLVGWIRKGLPSGYTEDDVSGRQFATAHAMLAAAMVLRAHAAVGYDRDPSELEGEARHMVNAALLDLDWLDDGDGVVSDGETGVNASATGAAGIRPRSHMTPSSGAKPTTWEPLSFVRRDINEDK